MPRTLTKDEERAVALSLPASLVETATSSGNEVILVQAEPRRLLVSAVGCYEIHEIHATLPGELDDSRSSLDSIFASSLSHLFVVGGHAFMADIYADARQRVFDRLESIVLELTTIPFGNPETGTIASDVAELATRFLSLLPNDVVPPRVAPDHEGGLVLAWEDTDPEILVTLDSDGLHFVANPGTARAEYYDRIPFDGRELPQELLGHLPR